MIPLIIELNIGSTNLVYKIEFIFLLIQVGLYKSTMFQEYLDLVTKSREEVVEVEKDTDKSREALSIKVQKQMEEELEKIKSEDSLKNYSVVSHHNVMTQHAHELTQIQSSKASRIAAIKKELDLALYELVEKPKEVPKITEMYKIISNAQNNQSYVCRVWFTLVLIEKWECKPGDPIRVEWVQVGINRANDSGIHSFNCCCVL